MSTVFFFCVSLCFCLTAEATEKFPFHFLTENKEIHLNKMVDAYLLHVLNTRVAGWLTVCQAGGGANYINTIYFCFREIPKLMTFKCFVVSFFGKVRGNNQLNLGNVFEMRLSILRRDANIWSAAIKSRLMWIYFWINHNFLYSMLRVIFGFFSHFFSLAIK